MREKLIELIASKVCDTYSEACEEWLPHDCGKCYANNCHIAEIADHLIANGVTFATDNNVGSRWIPVTERLPKTIPCGAGTEYSEAVNVLTTGRKVLTAIWDGYEFISDAEFWDAENEEITHWTPVLLPLPEEPKEVE